MGMHLKSTAGLGLAIIVVAIAWSALPTFSDAEQNSQSADVRAAAAYSNTGKTGTATDCEFVIDAIAVQGAVSDIWGEIISFDEGVWYMHNVDGEAIILAEEDELHVHFADEDRDNTIVHMKSGEPADFMQLVSNQRCGSAQNQANCDSHCEPDSCAWCNCSARVTCDHGVKSVSCTYDPSFCCEYECFPP